MTILITFFSELKAFNCSILYLFLFAVEAVISVVQGFGKVAKTLESNLEWFFGLLNQYVVLGLIEIAIAQFLPCLKNWKPYLLSLRRIFPWVPTLWNMHQKIKRTFDFTVDCAKNHIFECYSVPTRSLRNPLVSRR